MRSVFKIYQEVVTNRKSELKSEIPHFYSKGVLRFLNYRDGIFEMQK